MMEETYVWGMRGMRQEEEALKRFKVNRANSEPRFAVIQFLVHICFNGTYLFQKTLLRLLKLRSNVWRCFWF